MNLHDINNDPLTQWLREHFHNRFDFERRGDAMYERHTGESEWFLSATVSYWEDIRASYGPYEIQQ